MRLKNSGRKCFRTALEKSGSCSPKPGEALRCTPRFEVITIIAMRKSISLPLASVKRPSPSTPSNKSKTSGCAFSISSKRINESGRWRTCSARLRAPPPTCSRRWLEPGIMYSDMSTRIMRSGEPNIIVASCLASSVFPTPVGPTKKRLPHGFSGSFIPALNLASTREATAHAASCPMICRESSPRIAPELANSASESNIVGNPEYSE